MLKGKIKFTLIIALLISIISISFAFADEEEIQEENILDTTSISTEETEKQEETTESDVDSIKKYYKDYYASYLGEDAISGDVYKMDTNDIVIDKNVSGNVYVMGNKITISSNVIHGDVYIMGEEVNIKVQEIAGSVYILANNVKIEDSLIDNSLYIAADKVDFYSATLDMYVAAKEVTIQKNSVVQRNLRASAETLNLYGAVCKDAFVNFEKINFLSEEELSNNEVISGVFGNFEYSSKEEVKIPNNFIGGEINFTKSELKKDQIKSIAKTVLETAVFIIFIVFGLSLFASDFTRKSSDILVKNLGMVVIKGIAFAILIPFLIVGLFIFGITVNVALVLLGIYIILLAISSSVFVVSVANLIANKLKFNNKFGRAGVNILFAIIYAALLQIPYAGAVIGIVAGTLGLGLVLQKKSDKKVIIEENVIVENANEINNEDNKDKNEDNENK